MGFFKKIILCCFILGSCGLIRSDSNKNFLLITIDTWRADYISASGFKKVLTPNLDRIAQEGLYIKFVETPVPMTAPAHASILTGLYPKNHGIRDNRYFKLNDNVVTLAELFKEKGYKTIAIVSGRTLLRKYGLDKGFDIYDDTYSKNLNPFDKNVKELLKRAEDTVNLALEYIAKFDGPCFIWLHIYDPHAPYNPPLKFRELYKNDLYGGEVAYVDEVLGKFLKVLLERKNKRWTIIITSDHGEDLYEHGEDTHGILLYNSVRKVPFIFYDSDKGYKNFKNSPKSVIDIFPTVIELFNLKKVPCDGVSMFVESDRFLFYESYMPFVFSANPAFGVKKNEFAYLKHGTSLEVYYDDFKEKENLIGLKKEFVYQCEKELKNFYRNDRLVPSLKITEEESEKLKSLGYIGTVTLEVNWKTRCDLRELAKDVSEYNSIGFQMAKGDFKVLIEVYDKLIKKYPYAILPHCDKGLLLYKMGKFEEAYKECKICSMYDVGNSTVLECLGDISQYWGKYEDAKKYYELSLKFDPQNSELLFKLGILFYEKLKSKRSAYHYLKKFLEISPNNEKAYKAKDIIDLIEKETNP